MCTELKPGDFLLPETVPVMVLDGCGLFPHAMLPLYIFEPRYRAMLTLALETDRVVAIASRSRIATTGDDVAPIACAGLIRACLGNPDGTSQLVLQGLCRIRFTDWPQVKPFRIGAAEVFGQPVLEAPQVKRARLLELRHRLRDTFSALPDEIGEQLENIEDPDALTDLAASSLLSSPKQRQTILEEADPIRRQQLLITMLGAAD
jgi:Lon protease-like protein